MKNIAIVGAGIIGVTTAVAIQEALPNFRLTIFGESLTPETTGDGSAGLWGPYYLGDTPEADITRWAGDTHRWFENFWKSGLAPETGISLVSVIRVTRTEGFTKPAWLPIVYGGSLMTDHEIHRLNAEHGSNYKGGLRFVTYTAEPVRLLPWLMNKFTSAGGIIRNKRINTFNELVDAGYEIVINCCGLGARELASDSSLVPVRGHVTRVKAPWVFDVFIMEDSPGNYIIPNIDSVVLGGTGQSGDYELAPRETDAKFIREGCRNILPALEDCDVLKDWVGLRPGRPRVRLERECIALPAGKKMQVIHNYGHGGSGVTLTRGCALDVVEILKKCVNERNEFASKL